MRLVFLKQRYRAHFPARDASASMTRAKVYAYMGRTRSEPVSAQSGEKLRTNNIAMIVPQRFIALDLPFCASAWAASASWQTSAAMT